MKRLLIFILLASFCFGQYTFTTIEEFEFDETMAWYYDVVAMNDSIFVVVYSGGGTYDTILKSFEVDGDFTNITMKDSMNVSATNSTDNEIIKIAETVCLIVSRQGNSEIIYTYSFDANWDGTLVDSHTWSAMESEFDIVRGATTTDKAVIVAGDNAGGYLATFGWDDGTGNNISEIDVIQFDNGGIVKHSRIIAINDSIYVACFGGDNGDPYANAFNVGVDFDNIRDVDELVLWGFNAFTDIAYISSTHALTWYIEDDKDYSYFEVISFDVGTGDNITSVTSLAEEVMDPDLQNSQGELVQYPGGGDYVFFREFNGIYNARSYAIDGGYNVTDNGDSTRFSAITPDTGRNAGVFGDLLDSDSGTYVIVYSENTSYDGYLQTMLVESGGGGWAHQIMGIETPTAVNSASEFTKVSGVE